MVVQLCALLGKFVISNLHCLVPFSTYLRVFFSSLLCVHPHIKMKKRVCLFLRSNYIVARVSICWKRKCMFSMGGMWVDGMGNRKNNIPKKSHWLVSMAWNRMHICTYNMWIWVSDIKNGRCKREREFILQEYPVKLNLSIRYWFYGTHNQEMRCRFIRSREKEERARESDQGKQRKTHLN